MARRPLRSIKHGLGLIVHAVDGERLTIGLVRLITVVGDIEELYLETIGLFGCEFHRTSTFGIGHLSPTPDESGAPVENYQLPVAIGSTPEMLASGAPEKRFQSVVVLQSLLSFAMFHGNVEHIPQEHILRGNAVENVFYPVQVQAYIALSHGNHDAVSLAYGMQVRIPAVHLVIAERVGLHILGIHLPRESALLVGDLHEMLRNLVEANTRVTTSNGDGGGMLMEAVDRNDEPPVNPAQHQQAEHDEHQYQQCGNGIFLHLKIFCAKIRFCKSKTKEFIPFFAEQKYFRLV